jgi:VanZ family protein
MSKQEILSWTSIGFSFSVVFFYVMFVFGWPDTLPDYSARFTKIFINVFWVAIIIELIIDFTESKNRVNKDERDEKIEAVGHRYAYRFLTLMIVTILFQILLSNFLGKSASDYLLLGQPRMIFHALFLLLFSASIIKRSTMIYHYRKSY